MNISSIYSKIDNLQTPIVIQSFIASSNIFVKPIQTSSSLNKLSITKQLLTIDIIHPISHSYIPFVKSFFMKKKSFVSNIVKPIQTNSNIQQYPIYDNYSSSTPPMPPMQSIIFKPIMIQLFIALSNIFVKPIQTSSPSTSKLSITKQLLTIDIVHLISHSYIPFLKSFLTKKNSFVSNIVKPIQTNSNDFNIQCTI